MSTTKENIKSALKSKVIQMIFFYLLGASTVFVWQSDRHSKILLSYKDKILERELALQRLETEKENAEKIFNSKLAQKDTLIKS